MSRVDLDLLRAQVDTVSASQLAMDERVVGIDDSLIAHQVSLQSAVAELTTLVLVASNGERELSAKQENNEAALRVDIHNAVLRLGGTACNCPAGRA